jgi:drug/metabolite transporter (DMT)-like permease
MSLRVRIWLSMMAVYIAWGSTYLAIRFAVETIPPFLMAAARFLIAGIILYLWQRLSGAPAPSRRQWGAAAAVGLLLLLGGNGAVTWAEQYVPSGVTALMVGSAPLWMALIDAARPKGSRPNWMTAAGLVAGFTGIVLLVDPLAQGGGLLGVYPAGIAALMLAALLWALGSLYSRSAPLPESPLLGTAMEMLAGAGGLLLAGSLTGEWSRLDMAAISARSLWGLVYLVIFGSLVGFASYTWLLRVAPTPLVSTYAYVNPLVAILIGNLLAAEPLTVRTLLAASVILGSVALINLGRFRKIALTAAAYTD